MSVLALLIALIWIAAPHPAVALDPSRDIHQLKETRWNADQGAPANIFSMSQSSDGFIWLGTSSGLYRFDGVTFEHIPPITGDRTRSAEACKVLAARDGSVWVGHLWGGLSVYKNGLLHDANHGPSTGMVAAIVEGSDGAIWVATSGYKGAQISRYKDGTWTDAGVLLGLPSGFFHDMKFASDGTLWVLTDGLLSRLSPGSTRYVSQPADAADYSLVEDRHGRMWSLGQHGIHSALAAGRNAELQQVDRVSAKPFAGCALFDRDGNLFACRADTTLEVLRPSAFNGHDIENKRLGAAKEDVYPTLDTPSSLLEDKEGDLWVGGGNTLVEIKTTNVVWLPSQGVRGGPGPRIVMGFDKTLYASDLNVLAQVGRDGSFKPLKTIGSKSDGITTICADQKGGIWVALRDRLFHWTSGHLHPLAQPPGGESHAIQSCAVDGQNDLWLSVIRLGLFRNHKGRWTHVEVDPSHPNGWPVLSVDKQGRILAFAQFRAVWRLDGAQIERLGSTTSAGVGFVRTVHGRTNDILIGGDYGLSRYDGRRFHLLPSDRHAWLAAIGGIVETPTGDTWLNGAQGIVRLRTADLDSAFSKPDQPIVHQVFGVSDGLQGSVLSWADFGGGLAPGGALLFQTNAGRAWIDPNRLHRNENPPPVVIKAITAGGRAYPASAGLELPAGVRNLQIDYTALSLVAPERDQFRYRLSGVDKDWVDPGARRQAFYTNLNPGKYNFDVIAANNDGVWNKAGATLNFRIKPTFWQTPAFTVIIVLALMAALWLLYTLRLREMAHRIKLRHDDRLAERERIARELHDTLLQGFQGLTMRFQSVAQQIPETEPTRQMMDQALDRADEVLIEGRNRVRNLRFGEGQSELAFLIEAAAYRLRVDPDVEIKMAVGGDCRRVDPAICDEVLAIATEALFNAFTHSLATQINVSLDCDRQGLRLLIADNGVGIDPAVLEMTHRPGHYGFIGMRERANKLKAELMIRNSTEGAEVFLLVPRQVAYANSDRRWSPFPRPKGLES